MSNFPLSSYHFTVEWGGTRIGFTEVSGLDIEFTPIKYRDGASKEEITTSVPGLKKFSNIILKRGITTDDNEFFEWLETKLNNLIDKRDIIIKLLDEQHNPVVTWKAEGAYPVKYSGPILRATGNEVAMEQLELAHEGLTLVK
ncbi:MAG: phage tail protein [Bacteroidetes bacterium]|nr:phage tail protein [Bacteroidota bacterium]MBP7398381.1 phage tail protein [Chitinophagales bacterium]MBK7108801.1 phage tail protein [Bacteroidota bacterium]MBK8488873.1 phage tail protein [Bacteroidota bacterium]MBK8680725.1 phage tail protein [Bacteroidota bacterium]